MISPADFENLFPDNSRKTASPRRRTRFRMQNQPASAAAPALSPTARRR
jgi:hypothetical protein